jgi:hypothetical protein
MATERKMTVKLFLYKSGTKAANSAEAFINSYREFLTTGEVSSVVSPIIARIDAKEVMPTPGLELIRQACLAHQIAADAAKAEAKLEQQQDSETQAEPKRPWNVRVFNARGVLQTRTDVNGNELDMDQFFDLSQRASEWADRRLVHDCGADCFAVITHYPSNTDTLVLRDDAFARVFPKSKSPIAKRTGAPAGGLGFQAKAKPSRAVFSHG